jgi:cytoskeletal protein CcmA (bactofilin family)
MFNKKLKTDAFTNLIAEGTIISGAVRFTGIIKIQGTVKGDVLRSITDPNEKKATDCIIVDESGEVEMEEMMANDIIIGGKVTTKKIWAEGTIRILKNANIRGAVILYRTLEIEPGAMMHECELKHLDFASEGEVV